MTAATLIRDIEAACAGNLQREVLFGAMFELNASSPESDETKQITLHFSDCIIRTDHPTKVRINLC